MRLISGVSTIALVAFFTANSVSAQQVRNIEAAQLINGFSQLLNSAEGRAALSGNLQTSIGINNNSTDAQRALAVSDNTLAALVGSMNNGLLVADALGTKMSAVFSSVNSITAATFAAKTFSPNFAALFSQVNALIQSDSSFAKNFYANGSATGNAAIPATGISLPSGGVFNVYDLAYSPTAANRNTVGNSRPVQVDPDSIDTFTAPDFFGVSTDSAVSILPTLKSNASFPSGHSTFGFASSMLFAEMVPERFQEFLVRGSEYGNSRVVLGAHYVVDVIGARIMSTYTLAQILNNNPEYLGVSVSGILGNPMTTTNDFQALFASAQTDLRSELENGCGTTISQCITDSTADRFSNAAQNKADYTYRLTYGLAAVGPTDLAPVVPTGAEVLIATRFPYLSAEQRRDVLATTEIESGHVLDDGSGWARLNLYAAADGYGAFNGDVNVYMDASKGGFNASDTWANDIGGAGTFTKGGTGVLKLTGNNSFSGTTTIAGGKLVVNGYLGNSAVTIDEGATLGGSGTIGGLTVASGATAAPGNSIGTLNVAGDIAFAKGSIYQVEADSTGASDKIVATGAATLGGGSVLTLASGSRFAPQTRYEILTAAGGVTGAFDDVSSNLVFLDPQLSYGADDVVLTLNRNDISFAGVGNTPNQRAAATGADSLDFDNAAYAAITNLNADQARGAFDQLSGEIHASAKGMFLEDSDFLRDAATARLQSALGSATGKGTPTYGYGKRGAEPVAADAERLTIWGQAIGSWSDTDGDGNAASFSRDTGGFLAGADAPFADTWRLGIVGGYSHSSFDVSDRLSSGDSDNYHVGIDAGTRIGPATLTFGGAYSWHRIETKRNVAFSGFADALSADYDAATAQVFGEAAYNFDLAPIALQSFANLAYVNVHTDGFSENGGAAALSGASDDTHATFTTIGLRAAKDVALGDASATLNGTLGWRHAFGDVRPGSTLSFAGGDAFDIAGVPVAKDAAVVRAGIDFNITPMAKLGISYVGQMGSGVSDHGVNAKLAVRF